MGKKPHPMNAEQLVGLLESNPDSYVFGRVADQYRKSGELARAIEVCREGLSRHPEYVTGHIILGRCFVETNEPEQAVESFTNAVRLDRRNHLAIKMLSDLYSRTGDSERATGLSKALAAIDPWDEYNDGRLPSVVVPVADILGLSGAGASPPPARHRAEPELLDTVDHSWQDNAATPSGVSALDTVPIDSPALVQPFANPQPVQDGGFDISSYNDLINSPTTSSLEDTSGIAVESVGVVNTPMQAPEPDLLDLLGVEELASEELVGDATDEFDLHKIGAADLVIHTEGDGGAEAGIPSGDDIADVFEEKMPGPSGMFNSDVIASRMDELFSPASSAPEMPDENLVAFENEIVSGETVSDQVANEDLRLSVEAIQQPAPFDPFAQIESGGFDDTVKTDFAFVNQPAEETDPVMSLSGTPEILADESSVADPFAAFRTAEAEDDAAFSGSDAEAFLAGLQAENQTVELTDATSGLPVVEGIHSEETSLIDDAEKFISVFKASQDQPEIDGIDSDASDDLLAGLSLPPDFSSAEESLETVGGAEAGLPVLSSEVSDFAETTDVDQFISELHAVEELEEDDLFDDADLTKLPGVFEEDNPDKVDVGDTSTWTPNVDGELVADSATVPELQAFDAASDDPLAFTIGDVAQPALSNSSWTPGSLTLDQESSVDGDSDELLDLLEPIDDINDLLFGGSDDAVPPPPPAFAEPTTEVETSKIDDDYWAKLASALPSPVDKSELFPMLEPNVDHGDTEEFRLDLEKLLDPSAVEMNQPDDPADPLSDRLGDDIDRMFHEAIFDVPDDDSAQGEVLGEFYNAEGEVAATASGDDDVWAADEFYAVEPKLDEITAFTAGPVSIPEPYLLSEDSLLPDTSEFALDTVPEEIELPEPIAFVNPPELVEETAIPVVAKETVVPSVEKKAATKKLPTYEAAPKRGRKVASDNTEIVSVHQAIKGDPTAAARLEVIPDHVLTPTLADIYYQQDQPYLALEIYRRLLARDHGNPRLEKRIEQVEATIRERETVALTAAATEKESAEKAARPLKGVKIKKKVKEKILKTKKPADDK